MGFYVAHGLLTALVCVLLVRGVMLDLYARPSMAEENAPPRVCVEDADRLFRELSSRLGGNPALPVGDTEVAERELDLWEHRWDDELARVTSRCEKARTPEWDQAIEGLQELRGHLARCGEDGRMLAATVRRKLAGARTAAGAEKR